MGDGALFKSYVALVVSPLLLQCRIELLLPFLVYGSEISLCDACVRESRKIRCRLQVPVSQKRPCVCRNKGMRPDNEG